MPSGNPSSIQVAKTCEALMKFSNKVTIITPNTGLKTSLKNFYGLNLEPIILKIKYFKKFPLGINIGFAFTDHSYYGITGSGLLDLSYKLPFEKADLSFVLRLQKVVDINEDYELDFGAQDLYGVYVKYGRTLSF